MSNTSDTNSTLAAILVGTGLTITIHHAVKYDGGKCLLPSRKNLFRFLLVWMLIGSGVFMGVWAVGSAVLKYKLGWVYVPHYGPMPYPSEGFPQHWKHYLQPFIVVMIVAYSFQQSLNAEEGLYWFHLMRAVRSPKSAKGFLRTKFLWTWIAISCTGFIVLCLTGWIGYHGETDKQFARIAVAGGTMELCVALGASVVVFLFPRFLKDVQASGAGPEVRARLHFYHEANKVRTFFRVLFSVDIMVMGIDGLTEKKTINSNHLAADLLNQLSYLSYLFIVVISMIVYLPRNWNSDPAAAQQIMVGGRGRPQPHGSHVLMSLLRERGQWDADDDLRLKGAEAGSPNGLGKVLEKDEESAQGEAPFMDRFSTGDWENDPERSPRRYTNVLENWSSPLAIPVEDPKLPTQLKIHIQQEQQVHDDREGSDDEERGWRDVI
ncbi:hypothetical protein IAR55_005240 [Kwoniella newhampshirensis]|uniref:Uncharacterized protein n=1 Tax=Kwoniella newhampshirensis TaxID=1651941 RepID=A0AAW0YGX4_9TREE